MPDRDTYSIAVHLDDTGLVVVDFQIVDCLCLHNCSNMGHIHEERPYIRANILVNRRNSMGLLFLGFVAGYDLIFHFRL